MEIRVYKNGEDKRLELLNTAAKNDQQFIDLNEFRDITVSIVGDQISIKRKSELIVRADISAFKDKGGNSLGNSARIVADKIQAIISNRKEVDSYVIGSDLSEKSTETIFTHNRADAEGLGGRMVVTEDNAKLDVTRSSGQGVSCFEVDVATVTGYDRGTLIGKAAWSNQTRNVFTGQAFSGQTLDSMFTVHDLLQVDGESQFIGTVNFNGDIEVNGSALDITDLASVPSSLGTSGQVLAVNSGGTALEFVAQSGGSGGGGIGSSDQTLGADRTIDVSGNVLTIDDGTTDIMKFSSSDGVQVFGDFKVDSGGAISGGALTLEEWDTAGQNSITIRAPYLIASDFSLTLPDADGTSGQALTTDGSGTLEFSDVIAKLNAVVENSLSINVLQSASSPKLAIEGADGNGYVYLQVPDDISANVVYTLPGTDGSSGQVLKTNGSGVLTFTTVIDDVVDDTTPQLGGDLDVNGNKIVSASNGDISMDPDGSGNVVLRGNATQGSGRLVFNCENNSHGITLKGPPHSAAASYTLTLPDTDGAANEVLKTDGSGNLDWVATDSGVTSVTAGVGLDGGAITSTGTIDLADTSVTAGSYTSADITVDAQGRITSASNGSGGGGGGSGISNVVEDTTPQLGGDFDTNSKNIVYSKTSATDHSSNGEIVKIGTGSTTQGELCYYKSDGTWAAANASAESTSGGCLLGIALGTDPDVDGMLLRGMYTLDHSPGSLADELYVSTTAGDVTGNVSSYGQNNVVRVIGYCLDGSNGQIWFNPSNDFIVLA